MADRGVALLVCKRTGRSAWQCQTGEGGTALVYVEPTHYCSCDAFLASFETHALPFCAHVLAVTLAEALRTYHTEQVHDAEFPLRLMPG